MSSITFFATHLSIWQSCVRELGEIVLSVSLKAPLEVFTTHGDDSSHCFRTINFAPHFKSWVYQNFHALWETEFSVSAVYRGLVRVSDWTATISILEEDVDANVFVVNQEDVPYHQRHWKVDGIALLHAKLGEGLFCIVNLKGDPVYILVVRKDCLVLQNINLAFSEGKICDRLFNGRRQVIGYGIHFFA